MFTGSKSQNYLQKLVANYKNNFDMWKRFSLQCELFSQVHVCLISNISDIKKWKKMPTHLTWMLINFCCSNIHPLLNFNFIDRKIIDNFLITSLIKYRCISCRPLFSAHSNDHLNTVDSKLNTKNAYYSRKNAKKSWGILNLAFIFLTDVN